MTSLREIYEANEYPAVIDGVPFALRPGARCPELDALLERRGLRTAAYLTAFNPAPRVLPLEENLRRNAELRDSLAGLEIYDAPGGWLANAPDPRREREPSLIVLGISDADAASRAARFGQAAFVVHAVGEPSRVVMRV